MTILIPDPIGKRSLERERPFLMEFVLFCEQLFHQIQCTACKTCQRSSID